MVRRSEPAERTAAAPLPQTGLDQGDVVVAPSHHNVFEVGSSPKLASAEGEQKKPFERENKDGEKSF